MEELNILHDVDQELPRAPRRTTTTSGPSVAGKHPRKPSNPPSSLSQNGREGSNVRVESDTKDSTIDDGFAVTTLSKLSPEHNSQSLQADTSNVLDAMDHVRSIRGSARQEYGKIYAALNPYYKDAIRTKHPSNAKVFRTYRDPNQQAKMLAQVLRFANSDFSSGQQSREQKLLHMISAFEDAVTREFEQGLKIGDIDGRIRKYSNVLVTLNGGQRAIDRFVNENPIFRPDGTLGDPMDCISPSNTELLFLEESHAFFGRLSVAFNEQLDVIKRGFPDTINVSIPLLKKVGTDLLSPYLNRLFECLRDRNQESYVRAISGTYEQSLAFAKSLQPASAMKDSLLEAADSIIADTFAPHIERFLSQELAWFKRRSDTELNGWERQLSQQDASLESLYMANVNRQADKRDFLTSFKKVVMMPVNVLPAFPTLMGQKTSQSKSSTNGESRNPGHEETWTNSVQSETSMPTNGTAVLPSRTSTPFSEPPTTELAAKAAIMKTRLEGIKSLFSLEVALNLVHMAKASIERIARFAHVKGRVGDEARLQCETIFVLLLKVLGSRHVRTGFDQAVEHLSKYNPRSVMDRENQPGVAPLVIFLELVNVGDLIQQMIEVFFEQELVAPKLTDRNDFLNPTVKEKKRFEQMLDERVAAGLNKGIEVLMAEVEFLCATTQTVEDFNPGAAGVPRGDLVDVSPTPTAACVVEVVAAHTKMLVGSTDKNMLDVFNQEVGLRLFTTLCKHLKRQRISVAGSIRLIRFVLPPPPSASAHSLPRVFVVPTQRCDPR